MIEKLAAILRHNTEVCAAELRRLNIAGVEIVYSGQGSSIFLIDESGSAIAAETGLLSRSTVVYRQEDYGYGSCEDASFVDMPVSLDDALKRLCDLAIECSGREDGNGGGGSLQLMASSGELELEHYENVVKREYSAPSYSSEYPWLSHEEGRIQKLLDGWHFEDVVAFADAEDFATAFFEAEFVDDPSTDDNYLRPALMDQMAREHWKNERAGLEDYRERNRRK